MVIRNSKAVTKVKHGGGGGVFPLLADHIGDYYALVVV